MCDMAPIAQQRCHALAEERASPVPTAPHPIDTEKTVKECYQLSLYSGLNVPACLPVASSIAASAQRASYHRQKDATKGCSTKVITNESECSDEHLLTTGYFASGMRTALEAPALCGRTGRVSCDFAVFEGDFPPNEGMSRI
jgi:hypothetical protein